jgi:hypothetical protein
MEIKKDDNLKKVGKWKIKENIKRMMCENIFCM